MVSSPAAGTAKTTSAPRAANGRDATDRRHFTPRRETICRMPFTLATNQS